MLVCTLSTFSTVLGIGMGLGFVMALGLVWWMNRLVQGGRK